MIRNNIKFSFIAISVCALFFVISFSTFHQEAEAASILVKEKTVNYEIDGGKVIDMNIDSSFLELIVNIDSTSDGILEISIPRSLLDAKFSGKDDIFFVIVDGFDTEYIEITNGPQSRTLIIPFFKGDSQIEIIGTEILEEGFENIISGPSIKIPTWVKNNAGWWSDNLIGDSDFVSGIQYLITEGIMSIPSTQAGTPTSEKIPTWVKNNAGWWSDNQITDADFVSGIQYLISNGIMRV